MRFVNNSLNGYYSAMMPFLLMQYFQILRLKYPANMNLTRLMIVAITAYKTKNIWSTNVP